jgi:hypothetical protein
MQKSEIAAALARRFGYRKYLEICTPSTGLTYAQMDRTVFTCCRRLMYRCPPGFSDGLPIDCRTESDSSEALLRRMYDRGQRFDLVFVDPFHTHANSLCDLLGGLRLLTRGGVVLVHDCNPTDLELTSPEFVRGLWCGVTYVAWLDLMLTSPELGFVTVDTDYGCGIAGRPARLSPLLGYPSGGRLSRLLGTGRRPADTPAQRELIDGWRKLPLAEKYPFFDQHRVELLRLISVSEFCDRVGARAPD